MKATARIPGSVVAGAAKFSRGRTPGAANIETKAYMNPESVLADLPVYAGPYDVTPTVDGTTLETADKLMSADVEVLSIPYYEVGNTSGGRTVYIGTDIKVK